MIIRIFNVEIVCNNEVIFKFFFFYHVDMGKKYYVREKL